MNIDTLNKVNELNNNALYKISMSSIELFHSNFWDWMFNKYKMSIKYFFEGIVDLKNTDILTSKRERKHLDILIEDEDNFYIIENKIKSLPDKKQLNEYSEKIIGKKVFGKGIIASLVKLDSFEMKGVDDKWVHLDYQEIASRIERFSTDYKNLNKDYDLFDFGLIDRYHKMIKELSLVTYMELNQQVSYHFKTQLSKIGFDVVYKKLLGSMLKTRFMNHQDFQKYKSYLAYNKVDYNGIDYNINRTNLTFTINLNSHEENTIFGIQIEHYTYRWLI